jgi:hypothetical protein
MKKFYLTTAISVFFLLGTSGVHAQTTQPQLNQVELIKKFLGTWQASIGKDTVEVWESQLFGNAVIINVSQIIKGKKTQDYVNNMSYDSSDGKLKGFILNTNASSTTWSGSFSSEKDFAGTMLNSFKPETAWGKFAFVFTTPKEWIFTMHNMEGAKTFESKFTKVK